MFTRAIVRPPAPNFGEGLTTAGLGAPDYRLALHQHEAYCAALEKCGLQVTRLEPDPLHPDSCFVEDIAVLVPTNNGWKAIMTRPGARSRRGEVKGVRKALARHFPNLQKIRPPGTLDGGDVCQAGSRFFIGISERTEQRGVWQFEEFLRDADAFYTTTRVDIRGDELTDGLLHLKSGVAYLGNEQFVIAATMPTTLPFAGCKVIYLDARDAYAANSVRVNDYLLIAAGYPEFESNLHELGYQTIALEMSEFQKMDGGLSCLSLRF